MSDQPSLLGIIGKPLSHSASPAMHNAAILSLDLPVEYRLFPLESEGHIGPFLQSMKTIPIRGINVTVPYKEAVLPFLDQIDDPAKRMGAVNTIVNQDGVLTGYNTDGDGFLMSLRQDVHFDVSGKVVTLLGAGGAAKGIAFSLLDAGVKELIILNRTLKRAEELRYALESCTRIPIYVGDIQDEGVDNLDFLKRSDLIVQTTSVGLLPNEEASPLQNFSWVREGQVVYDIIYKPKKTQFLKGVERQGGRIYGGAGMLAGQGVLAFKLFTGEDVSISIMKKEIYK